MNNDKGFSIIEVLVACAVFTIGLLGLVDAQLIALRQNQQINIQANNNNQKSNQVEEALVTSNKI